MLDIYNARCGILECNDLRLCHLGESDYVQLLEGACGQAIITGHENGSLKCMRIEKPWHSVGLSSIDSLLAGGASPHIGAIKLGKEIQGFAVRGGTHLYGKLQNALITMYSRCKEYSLGKYSFFFLIVAVISSNIEYSLF